MADIAALKDIRLATLKTRWVYNLLKNITSDDTIISYFYNLLNNLALSCFIL